MIRASAATPSPCRTARPVPLIRGRGGGSGRPSSMIRPAGHHATTGAQAQDQPQGQRTAQRPTAAPIRQEDGALIVRCAPVPRLPRSKSPAMTHAAGHGHDPGQHRHPFTLPDGPPCVPIRGRGGGSGRPSAMIRPAGHHGHHRDIGPRSGPRPANRPPAHGCPDPAGRRGLDCSLRPGAPVRPTQRGGACGL